MVGPGRHERSWIRGAQAGSASDLEALFREHWPRAHRAAYLVVQDAAAAEDIAQEAFLAASAISIVSTASARSAHGSIASSSTGRSTGPGPERFGARRPGRRRRRIRHGRPRHLLGGRRGRARVAPAGAPGRDRPPLPPRLHARRDRQLLDLPRGTVNSRLRRGLDRLEEIIDREHA